MSQKVTKKFRQDHATGLPPELEDVLLEVGAGEFVALLGASGCGKSALLSILAGLEEPTGGQIGVAGSGAALMFQEAALFPWLTAGRNVELALRLRGIRRSERRQRVEQCWPVRPKL